jgi:CHAT domain-containing protein
MFSQAAVPPHLPPRRTFIRAAVPLVDDILGNTTLYEDHRGDFCQALKETKQHCEAARRTRNVPLLSLSLLSQGIVLQLQGETTASRQKLEEVMRMAVDPDVQLHAASYALHSLALHFNFFPGGGMAKAADIDVLINLEEIYALWSDRIATITRSSRAQGVLLEHEILQQRRYVMLLSSIYDGTQTDQNVLQTFTGGMERHLNDLKARLYPPRDIAALHLRLSDVRSLLGELDLSRNEINVAVGIYEGLSDGVGKANCFLKQGDHLAAPFTSPETWNTLSREGLFGNDLHWKQEIKEWDISRHSIADARRYYDMAWRLYVESDCKRGMGALQLRLGFIAALESKQSESLAAYDNAASHVLHAYGLFEAVGDNIGLQLARAHLALCGIGTGQFQESRNIVADIVQWSNAGGSYSFCLGLARMISRIGRRWLVRDGDYEHALWCLRLAEKMFQDLGARRALATVLQDQMRLYQVVGDRSRCNALAQRVLDECEELSKVPQLAPWASMQSKSINLSLFSLAQAHRDPAGMKRILNRFKGRERPQVSSMEEVLATLGRIALSDTPDYDLIPSSAQDGLVLSLLEQAEFLEPLYRAREARMKGKDIEARQAFCDAEKVSREGKAFSKHLMMALILSYERRFEEALLPLRRYVDEQFDSAASMLMKLPQLGNTDFSKLSRQNVLRLLASQKGLLGTLPVDRFRNIFSQGFAFAVTIKSFGYAAECLQNLIFIEGEDWWQRDGDPWENLTTLAELQEGRGDLNSASMSYEQAMNVFEEQRHRMTADQLKLSLASRSSTSYMYIQAARVALKQYEAETGRGAAAAAKEAVTRAFAAIERGRTPSLLDLMGSGLLGSKLPSESEAVQVWQDRSAFLATRCGLLEMHQKQESPDPELIERAKEEVADAERQLDDAESKIAAANPSFYHALSIGSKVLTLDEAAQMLDEDTLVLQYAFSSEDLCAWAMSRRGIIRVHQAKLAEYRLEQSIRECHSKCGKGDPNLDSLTNFLADQLINPFDICLEHHRRVVFVPVGAGHLLPFHALPWRGAPLISTHTISYLPSMSLLQFLKADQGFLETPSVLAVGNPANMFRHDPMRDRYQDLSALPYSEIEVKIITGLLPTSTCLVAQEATSSAVREKLSKHPILHFATHGYLDADVPMLSSIFLANGETLTVADLTGMRTSAVLVVLSACRTGEGEATAGDDVVGFSRALFAAGVRSVIVSLWPVDDLATSILMSDFYSRLVAGETAPEALCNAQNSLRTSSQEHAFKKLQELKQSLAKTDIYSHPGSEVGQELKKRLLDDGEDVGDADYSHPMYWAPYVLMGR